MRGFAVGPRKIKMAATLYYRTGAPLILNLETAIHLPAPMGPRVEVLRRMRPERLLRVGIYSIMFPRSDFESRPFLSSLKHL